MFNKWTCQQSFAVSVKQIDIDTAIDWIAAVVFNWRALCITQTTRHMRESVACRVVFWPVQDYWLSGVFLKISDIGMAISLF